MKQHQSMPGKSLLATAVLMALVGMQRAHAADEQQPAPPQSPAPQAAPEAKPRAAADEAKQQLETVVVTGSARREGLRKLDASFSITTADEEQIKQAAPSSTADLMKIVPGAHVEATGGVAGANIMVRGFPADGDARYVTIQMMGSPLYPPPTLSFLENSSLFRLDDTVERVEVLRGGPSPIFSNGQPGMTMNFMLKKGTNVPEGSIRLTTGTGDLRRLDAFYGGKIADNWYGSIGGFYRVTNGVRDAGFPSDEGGQVTGTLTRKLNDGELTFYARTTSDRNAFYTGVPLIASTGNGNPTAFPGFNPLTGTPLSNQFRRFNIYAAPGVTVTKDLGDGRGWHGTVLGMDFGQKINGWDVSNKANYLSGDAPTNAVFTNPPRSMGSYLSSAIAANGATSGIAKYIDTGALVDPSTQVMSNGLWAVEKRLKSFTDEFRVSKELIPNNTVTGGLYLANYSSHDVWYLGNSTLMTATPNARPITVTLNNGVVVAGPDGRDGPAFYSPNAYYDGRNTALFVADEWKLNKQIRIDGGIRRERQRLSASISNLASGDTDNNPLTIYNNNTSIAQASNTAITRDDTATSFTVGVNYALSDNFSVFGRANSGHALPAFDDLRGAGSQAAANDRSVLPLQNVRQYELGLKTVTKGYSAFLTFFHNDFKGLPNEFIGADGTRVFTNGGSTTNGLEFEASVRPVKNFQVALTGDYMRGHLKDFADPTINGKNVQRQPKLSFRLSPSYRIPLGDDDILLYATYTYVGDRYSDLRNTQVLPKYHTIDIGALYRVGDFEFRFAGTNITNEFGLTEGNPRIVGGGGPAIVARPLFGRAYEVSMAYRF